MNKKIFAILALLIVILCCISIVSADNGTDDVQTATDDNTVETTTDTTDNSDNASEPQTIDLSNYITALSIGNTVTFSDGFTGFSLDPSKAQITTQDGFTAKSTAGVPQANYLKLAVIESYKAGNEGDIGSVISSFVDGSYQSSSNPIVQSVLSSSDSIGDYEVVKINNNTEATFEFEVLEPVDSNKPSYFAYRVSFNSIPDEKLSSTQGDGNGSDNDTAVSSVENDTQTSKNVENDTPTTQNVENDTPVKSTNDNNVTKDSSKTADNDTNKTNKTDNNTSKKTTNKTDKKTANNTSKKTTDNTKKPVKKENTKTEPKKTVVNKTTTKTDNDKNAQPENHKNVRNYNEQPKQAEQNRLQEVGRPIAILIAVAVLGGAIAIVLHRKD